MFGFEKMKKGRAAMKGRGAVGRKPKGRKTQAFTSPPLKAKGSTDGKGKKKTSGHSMGNLFGATPKKPEADSPPRTQAANKANRMKRLEKTFI